jgi:hypothetical protein
MKRNVIDLLGFALAAALVIAVLQQSKHQTPFEIARLSESLVISRVDAYCRNQSEPNFAAVKVAIANHRVVLGCINLSREAREVMEVNLNQQIWIVRTIARNYDLKL